MINRLLALWFIWLTTVAAFAQSPSSITDAKTLIQQQQTFSELVTLLPALIHDIQADKTAALFGEYSEAMDKALKRDPHSAYDALPGLKKNLESTEPDVQALTAATLQEFMLFPADFQNLMQPLVPSLLNIITGHNESAQKLAFMDIMPLSKRAPDSAVDTVTAVMFDSERPQIITVGAAETLIWLRPGDTSVQNSIISVMRDPKRPAKLRQALAGAMGNASMNSLVIDELVQIVNTSSDSAMRDAAISSLSITREQAALTRISHRLDQIMSDPNESTASHEIAKHARCELTSCVETR